FEGDARGGLPTTEPARIDWSLHLASDVGIVDRHFIASDDHFDADRQRLVASTVVVEEGLGRIDAVGHRTYQRARRRLRLVEDDFDSALERRDAVFVDQLRGEVAP